jgi:hypothetical protein
MLRRHVVGVIVSGLLVATGACVAARRGGTATVRDGVSFEGGAVILTGAALRDGAGTVLAAMRGKVPNFRVWHRAGRCPDITLRSATTMHVDANPHVYVDGTRATDTCILETLRTEDVDRIEVYPQGFTKRPGYGTHAPGLILVFMRST